VFLRILLDAKSIFLLVTWGNESVRSGAARGVPKPMIRLPVPGKLGRALHDGQLTEPEARHGTKVWAEWLRLTSS